MFTGPNPSIEAETEPQADDVLAKWVPYALVNLYLYHGWRIVTGYRPSHHDTWGIRT